MANPFIIKKPIITEKSTDLTRLNKYVFHVDPASSSAEIRKAVHEVYGVDVTSINIINRKAKFGSFRGVSHSLRTKKLKKAIVTIKEGQSIDIIAH